MADLCIDTIADYLGQMTRADQQRLARNGLPGHASCALNRIVARIARQEAGEPAPRRPPV